MAINKNHEFEELNGVKCGIVEKNVAPARVAFLKNLLEQNKFTVVVVPSAPVKATAPAAKTEESNTITAAPEIITPEETFIVGVTDYTFNATNAILEGY